MRTIQYFLDDSPITGVVPAGSVTVDTTQYTNGRHLLYAAATTTSGTKTNYDPIVLIVVNIPSLSSTPPTPTPSPKPSDLNGDGKVDILDYNILITDFGKTGSSGWIPADIIKNGKVDIFDHSELVSKLNGR